MDCLRKIILYFYVRVFFLTYTVKKKYPFENVGFLKFYYGMGLFFNPSNLILTFFSFKAVFIWSWPFFFYCKTPPFDNFFSSLSMFLSTLFSLRSTILTGQQSVSFRLLGRDFPLYPWRKGLGRMVIYSDGMEVQRKLKPGNDLSMGILKSVEI